MKYQNLIFGILGVFLLQLQEVNAQTALHLNQCYEWAEANYPLLKQKALNTQLSKSQMDNLETTKYPTIQWNAQASIQSEALEFAFPIPGAEPIELPIYRLQTTIDAGYLLWDGGLLSAKKEIEKAVLASKQEGLAVELYQIKEKVGTYFWGLIMLNAQDSVLWYANETIIAKISKLEAAEKYGTLLPAQLKKLQVQQIKIEAQLAHIAGQKKSLWAVLSKFTGQTFSENTKLAVPEMAKDIFDNEINRPELGFFDTQKQQIFSHSALLDAQKKPKVSAFLQAGIGYPNPLNFFDTEISPFAIGGIKFNWNFIDWGRSKKQKQILMIQAQMIDNRKETFVFNLSLLEDKYREDIIALEKQIIKDEAILNLQKDILNTFSAQLDHGIITVSEYTTQLNDATQAQLQLNIHRLQIRKLQSEYLTKIGQH